MPYAPGIQDISGQLRARGLDTVGDSLSSAITNITQLKNQAKAMQAMFKALTPEKDVLSGEVKPHPLGMTQDQFDALSWRDQIATMGGFIQSVFVTRNLQELAANRQAEAERRTGETALGNLLSRLPENAGVPMDNLPIPAAMPARSGTGPPVSGLLGWPPSQARPNLIPGGYAAGLNPQSNPLAALTAQPGPDTTEAPIRPPPGAPAAFGLPTLIAGLQRLPPAQRAAVLNNPRFLALASIAERMSAADERAQSQQRQEAGPPETTSLSGLDTIFNRKTGQFQISPYSKEQAKPTSPGYAVMADPDDPFGRTQIHMPLDQFKTEFPDAYERMTKSGAPAPDAPTDPKARKVGTIYKLPKGNFKWTAAGWVKP